MNGKETLDRLDIWNCYLVQRKAVPQQCELGIALDFSSQWRILFLIKLTACYIHVFLFSLQFSSFN